MKRPPIPLRDLLSYEPATGDLRWIAIPNRRIKLGSKAGTQGSNGRSYVIVNRKRIAAARIAWLLTTGTWPDGHIDHINGDPSDDRLVNLRNVCVRTNAENKRKPASQNKTGFLGVHKAYGRFKACLQVAGKTKHLGSFDTPEAAHEAYVLAKRQFHEGCTL